VRAVLVIGAALLFVAGAYYSVHAQDWLETTGALLACVCGFILLARGADVE
jgi:hypothetical protein